MKYREGFIKNRYIGRTFIMPGQEQREKSVRRKLNAIDLEFRGKNVLLVDDSIVRGTTSAQIIEMAREAGAAQGVLRLGRAAGALPERLRHRHAGRQRAGRQPAAPMEEVARLIGADWLIYQDLEDLVAAVPARQCAHQGVRHLLLLRRIRHRRRDARVPRAAAARALGCGQGRAPRARSKLKVVRGS